MPIPYGQLEIFRKFKYAIPDIHLVRGKHRPFHQGVSIEEICPKSE